MTSLDFLLLHSLLLSVPPLFCESLISDLLLLRISSDFLRNLILGHLQTLRHSRIGFG